MDAKTLKDLMARESDPKYVEARAKYSNAQIAVDLAYRLAKDISYPDVVKVEEYDALTNTTKTRWADPTLEVKAEALVKCARILKTEIEKDLNETLKVLEVDNGAKSNAS